MASRTAPVKARCNPMVSSSNLGHKIPGVSSSSSPWSTVIHCFPRVTPGRSPALADFFLATLLIKVDLPTLGMPTTMARTGRPTWPFSFHLAICSFSAARITGENCLPPAPLRASHSKTEIPWARKYAPQTLLAAGSAWSARLRMTTRGFPPTSSSKSGFRLAMGIRASMTSATTSTYLRFSPIIRRVLVMWPGYHWMFTFLSSPFPAGAAARPGTVLFHN